MTQGDKASDRLVSSSWLAARLKHSSIRIIEVSASKDDDDYREGHIPGAVWWYWKDALWHETDREFPTPEEMALRLGKIGIDAETTIVLYGDPIQYGTYAFWVLTMAGHKDVRLLDGGKKGWLSEGLPLSTEIIKYGLNVYAVRKEDRKSRVGRDDVRSKLKSSKRLLLDVRSPEEYIGARVMPPSGFDHGAERTGRIPGAVHLFFRELVNEDDTFLNESSLTDIFARAGITPGFKKEIVTYCRLSHRATLAWFALQHILGYSNAKVYDGSWTEWGSIVGFPIER
ncbi:MAG: sulfurtransferase [Chloroflexi bacterium]|nr:sulfurtransferase [Chloroflexota bacterium]